MKVPGRLQAMTVDRQGTVALFTDDAQGYKLWTVPPGGTATSVRVPALDTSAASATGQGRQAAIAPDGTYYIALDGNGLWQVAKDGSAKQIIRTSRADVTDSSDLAHFTASSVTGVAVADDGTVYFTDPRIPRGSVLVHRLKAGVVTKVAGRTLSEGQKAPSGKEKAPSGKDKPLLPRTGAPATSTLIDYEFNAGPLAWTKDSLFLHTGRAVLRITANGRLVPMVSGGDHAHLGTPDKPFAPFGTAFDGYVAAPSPNDAYHASSIAADPASGDVYYGAGDPTDKRTSAGEPERISADFDWTGTFTPSQQAFIDGSQEEQVVYQATETGELAAVTARSKMLAISGNHLYLAADSCAGGFDTGRCADSDRSTAVVRLLLPNN